MNKEKVHNSIILSSYKAQPEENIHVRDLVVAFGRGKNYTINIFLSYTHHVKFFVYIAHFVTDFEVNNHLVRVN